MTRNRPPDVRRQEIFEAALKYFIRDGYYKTSIDEIAAEVGITKPAVYYHFKSKKRLYIELFHYKVFDYFKQLEETIRGKKDAVGRILGFTRKSGAIYEDNRDVLRFFLEFVSMGARDPEIRSEVTAFCENRIQTFSEIIRQGVETGTLKEVDPDGTARALFFLSMGFFLIRFSADVDFDPSAQHRANMQAVFKGIRV